MLLRFEVSNHRSIMEPVELSMVAVDVDRPSVRWFERLNAATLNVVSGCCSSGRGSGSTSAGVSPTPEESGQY